MTTVTASPQHHQPAGKACFRRRTTVAPVPVKTDAMPPIVAESYRRVQRRRPILDDARQSTLNDAAPFIPRRSRCPIKSP